MNWLRFKYTLFGGLILGILVIVSFLYSVFGPEEHATTMIFYDSKGKVFGVPPLLPSVKYPMGTDLDGRNIFYLLLDGLKYTILIVVGVAVLRVVIGGIIGSLVAMWLPKGKKVLKTFLFPFLYVPSLIIAIILMAPIALDFELEIPLIDKIIYQSIILLIIGLPSILFFTIDFVEEIKKKSFITASYLLGATHRHVLIKQVLPNLRSPFVLLTVQHLLLTLQTMMYLGILGFYIGGRHREAIVGTVPSKYKSVTSELAGLNGQNYWTLNWAPWVVLTSILGIFLIILIVNLMKKEIEDHINGKVKRNRKANIRDKYIVKTVDNHPFEIIGNRKSSGINKV